MDKTEKLAKLQDKVAALKGRRGASVLGACERVPMSSSTISRWLNEATEANEGLLRAFLRAGDDELEAHQPYEG